MPLTAAVQAEPGRARSLLAMLVAAFFWGISLMIVFMAYRTIGSALQAFVRAGVIAAAAGAVAVGFRYSAEELLGPKKWRTISHLTLASSVAVLLTHFIAFGAVCSVNGKQRAAWIAERDAFEKATNGFVPLQALAKNQFGLLLELAHDDDAFLKTTHASPGSSSAEVELQPGFCLLSVWPTGVARSFEADRHEGIDDGVVLRLITMHELGHCVDMSRDAASFTDPHVSTKSVAPIDVSRVHDVASLYEVGRGTPTSQWREVYADLFAIGYARITYPALALAFERYLSGQRAATAELDPVHATACWIDAARKSPGPGGLSDLARWADQQRAEANCKLAQDKHA
jgi:hypothetical protein